jgi:peptidyl-prolyl cis-trans isomerase SurA
MRQFAGRLLRAIDLTRGNGGRPASTARLRRGAAIALIAAAAALPFGPAQPVAAQEQRVAILVNDSPISEYDIQQRTKLLEISGGARDGSPREKAIEELIEERLKAQEAKRLGITVSDDEIQAALQRIAEATKTGTVSRLKEALGSAGVNIRTLEDRFRADIAWRDVVRRQFQQSINIREQDVIAAVQAKGGNAGAAKTTEFTLQQITLPIADNSSVAQRRSEAEKIRANIRSCSDVRSVASAFKDVAVRDVGQRMANELPDATAKELQATPIGRATAPEVQPSAIQLVVVCDKREVTGLQAARAPVESELRNEQGNLLARRLLRDLRADALIERR